MAENGVEDGEGRRVVLAGGGGWDFGEGGKTTVTTTDLDNKTGLSLLLSLCSRMDSPGLSGSSSSRTGRNRACPSRGRAS